MGGRETRPVLGHRPVCPYPKTALYNGLGDTHVATSFRCDGNLESTTIIQQDQLAQHKAENGTGKIPPPYGGS